MKRRLAVLLIICILASIMAACGGSGDSGTTDTAGGGMETAGAASSNEEVIELAFPCIWVGTDSKAEVFGQMVRDFNAEYDGQIKVSIEDQTDYNAYRDKLRTQLSTGSAPDIFTVESYADLELFSESGKLMDLTEFLGTSSMADRFREGLIDASLVDGINYGFAYENVFVPIMYNSSLLKEAGIETIPESYDQLWTACEALGEKGIFPTVQMTNDNAWFSMLWYSYALASCGGANVYENGLDDPAFVEAAGILKKMFDYTSSDAVGADATVGNGHFFNERAAIYTNGTWILGRILSEGVEGLYDNVEVGPSLSVDGENGGAYINVIQSYICASAQEDPAREEAIQKFFEFITQEDKIVELTNSSGSTFAITIPDTSIEDVLLSEVVKKANDAAFTVGHFQGSVETAVANAFASALESLVLGDVNAQGFVDMLKKAETK